MDDLFKIIKANSDFLNCTLDLNKKLWIISLKNISELDKGAVILKYLLKLHKIHKEFKETIGRRPRKIRF